MVLRVPLPGGRSISFNQDTGVLRINLEPESDRKGPSSGVPPLGTVPLEQVLDSIQVRDTGTPKGFGAFCSSDCDDESFLGFYQGETIISRTELDARITKRKISTKDNDGGGGGSGLIRNAMDYVMSLDGGVTFIDGYERAQDKKIFSPVHLNHAEKGTQECNVIRLLEDDRVAFFTSRDIVAGEELCFDYGSNFWNGREDMKI